jgi:hypothetical protein
MGRTAEDICNLALLYAGVNQRIGSLNDATDLAQACNTLYVENRKNQFSDFRWPFAIKRQQLTPLSGVVYTTVQTFAQRDLTTYGPNVYRSLQAANLNNQPDISPSWWVQVTRDGWAYVCPLPDDYLDFIAIWEKPTVSAFGTPPVFTPRDFSQGNLRNPRSMDRTPAKIENANDGTDAIVLLTDVDTPILEYAADVQNPGVYPTEFVELLAWRMAGPLAISQRGDEKKGEACMRMAAVKLGEAFIVSARDQQEDEEPVSEFEASREGAP